MKDNDKKRREVRVASREELLGRSSSHSREDDTQRRSRTNSRDGLEPIRRPSESRSRTEREPVSEPAAKRRTPSTGQRPKKKKKKRIKRIFRIALVLTVFVLLAGLLLAGLFSLFSGSKGAVRRAYAKTISSYQKRDDIVRTILGNDAAKYIKKGDLSQSFTLKVTDNTAGASDISVNGTLNKNTSSKTADAQFGISYKDVPAAQFKMYTDNKQIMFSSPGVYDDWLAMDCDNIMTQLSNSVLGQDIDISETDDFSLKLFSGDESQGEVMMSLADEVSQIFTKEMDNLSKKAEYTRIKEKKSVMIDGAEKKCRGYSLSIKGDDLKNSLVNVLSKLRTSKKVKSYLAKYAEIEYSNVSIYRKMFDSSDRLVEQYYQHMDNTLDTLNRASFIDTNAEVYLYKGVIADMDFNTVYNIDSDQVKVNLHGGMYGGSRPYEDVSLVLTLASGAQTLTASYTENTDNYDSTFVNNRAFVFTNGEKNDLELQTNITFDKKTGVINGSVDVNTPSGGYIDLNANGTLTKANGMTTITAQEIKLDYNNAFTLVMEGSYSLKPFKQRVQPPDGNIIELFKADAAQIEQIRTTIGQNLDNAINGLNKALESIDGVTVETTQEGQSETTTASETTTQSENEKDDDTSGSAESAA